MYQLKGDATMSEFLLTSFSLARSDTSHTQEGNAVRCSFSIAVLKAFNLSDVDAFQKVSPIIVGKEEKRIEELRTLARAQIY